MKSFILTFLVFMIAPVHAEERKCTPDDARWCSAIASHLRGQDSQATYDFSKKGCDYGDLQSCQSLYTDSIPLGAARTAEAKDYLIQKCSVPEAVSGDVAQIYYDEKEIAKALIIDRKYYLKYFQGAYPLHAYRADQKKEGFEAAKLGCEKDPLQCAFFMRYMPDHPQIAELLVHAQAACNKADGKSTGATTCAILGTYYYANQKHPKAIEIWNSECKLEVSSDCELILGSDADTETKLRAYQYSCKAKGCKDRIPEAVIARGRETLHAFLKEQAVR